ncbi:hypothetical protein SAMN05444365_101254 [Micromonospora pattaloongensis]|uniref:DoxX protein n=1 Tax=Micromonospora pattaloongensis TaxID=405436 RepID=A0A1H3G4X8_9ACTN|nr:hypothetical protein [Micromonospora pattaloongensis]SDX97419.1 hypothetical protein SAMN05444365_101254 [Micromonospora pattaloongensis]
MFVKASHLPERIFSGAYILHSGLTKRNVSEEQAAGIHGMAVTAYPFLGDIPPKQFVRLVSTAELVVGAALLTPVIPSKLAGLKLTAFAASLLGLYARLPGMRQPGTIWPTEQGIGLAKDSWLLGIGLSLLMNGMMKRQPKNWKKSGK